MPFSTSYLKSEPSRHKVRAIPGPAVIEFGTPWCGYCRAAQPKIAHALSEYPQVQHFKIEDGKGRPLGRSFGVKLWPTLIFLNDGEEIARTVRPESTEEIAQALAESLTRSDQS